MRKINIILVGFALFIFLTGLSSPALAQETFNYEHIKKYDVDITITQEGRIDVVETILYHFNSPRHGIFREVPKIKTNQDGDRFVLDFSNILVSDENDNRYNFVNESTSEDFILRIGDPDKTVRGDHTYIINYTVSGALTYFSDHDELYWNAVGTGWEVPVNDVSVTVRFPNSLDNLNAVNLTCFKGAAGSTNVDCTIEKAATNARFDADNFAPNEGLTIVVGFPKGYVQVLEPQKDYSGLKQLIFIAIFVVLLFCYYIVAPAWIFYQWLKNRKHPDENKVATAWFEPPATKAGRDLTSAEAGVVYDKTTDIRDLTSLLIQLAQKGYLKIVQDKEKAKKFYMVKEQGDTSQLLDFEANLLAAIFKKKDQIEVSELNKQSGFISDLKDVYEEISEQLVKDNMFAKNAYKIEKQYSNLLGLGVFGLNIFWIIACVLARKSTPRTDAGAYAAAQIKSLRNFLSSQDEQLEFQAKNQMFFEKLLPYAIALGVEKIWIERFKDIKMTQPDWLESDGFNNLVYYSMIRDFNSSVTSATAMSSTRSSSGFSSGFSGGSSGGGGGGGGGGSW